VTDWCILRVVPRETLKLATSLAKAGFETWTPTETVKPTRRRAEPWEKPRPLRKAAVAEPRPLVPGLVFARADRLLDLIALARFPAQTHRVWDREQRRMVLKGHPYFTLFRSGDSYSRVPDDALLPLRRSESVRNRKPRGEVRTWKPGDRVKLVEGAYAGLHGTVVKMSKSKQTQVRFTGAIYDCEVPAWILLPDLDDAANIQNISTQPECGTPLRSAA
jgi:transcription antitermination factor NusG